MKRRRRRRVIRFLGWGIGAFASSTAVLLLLMAAYLLFADYPEQVRRTVEEQLTEVSGAPSVVRSINLDLFHNAFELQGIAIATPGQNEPILELGRVWGKLRLFELFSLRVHWEELLFDDLTLHLTEDPEHGLILPGGTLEARPFTGLALSADRIAVSNAVLVIANEKVPWQLEASNLALALTRRGVSGYEGRLDYDSGQLRIKDHEELRASLTAHFELHPSELLVREAAVVSEVGRVDFTGKLGFADGVRGRFALSAEGDAAGTAESLFGVKDASKWAEGRASFRGSLTVEPENKVLEGTVLLPRGKLSGVPMADWTAEVFWDHSLMQISYARGAFAGGAAKMQLHQPLPVSEYRAALEWEVEAASLAQIIAGTTGRTSPIESLVSGRGGLSLAVEAPEGGESQFEVEGVAPPELSAAVTPVSFLTRGRLLRDRIEIENAEFRTSFLTGTLSGFYPSAGSARILLDVESTDLAATDHLQRELRRVVSATDGLELHLWNLSGRGQAHGELTARLEDARFEGDVSSEDLRVHGLPLGDLRARVLLSPERISLDDLVARKADGGLAGRASLSLSIPSPERSLELDVTLSRWPIDELARHFQAPLPLQGYVSGLVRTRPGARELEGSAVLELANGAVAGVPFERGEARIELDGRRIRIDPLSLSYRDAGLSGRIEVDVVDRTLVGLLQTAWYPLDGLGPHWAELSGTLEGKVEVSGGLDQLSATFSGRGRDVRLRGVDLGEAFISGTLRGDAFALTMTVEREAAELAVEAEIGLEAPFLARGRARWDGVDTSGWIGFPSDASAVSDGVASFRLPLHSPDALELAEADIELEQLVLESDRFHLETDSPVEIRLRQGRLELASAVLTEGGTNLTLGGGLGLEDGSLDLQIDGTVSFGVLETFYPSLGIATTGETFVSARVGGTRKSPTVTGFADFRGGSIRFTGFRQAIADLDGRIVFDNRTLRIPGLRGVFGSGPVELSGSIAIDGLSPAAVDLAIRGSEVRLRYPEGFVATLEGELSLLGNANERVLGGTVVLTDATWTREYDLISGILSDREGLSLFDDLASSELFRNLRLDVEVSAPHSLRVRNSLATIEGSAELELRGTVSEPVLLGRSEAERGDIYFLGQRYNITSGKVDFVDPTRIEPFVDLTAETRVRSYRVELRLTGTPQRVHPELTSDPPLRTVDILRLLSGANERDIFIGNEEEELAGVGVASLLTERLTQEVGRRAERLFGLDRFSINPFLVGQFANPTARVSLGKQITRELSINYSTNLNATTEAIILIEYTPEGPMSWILSRDEEGDIGIDVKFRKSF